MYPVFPPFLQDQSYYCIAFSIVKEVTLLMGHSDTFLAHCVYGFIAVLGSSYATKVGGSASKRIPIA